MTGTNQNGVFRFAVERATVSLVLGFMLAGAMHAQQSLVANAAQPVLHPALQLDPGPAGLPAPQQGTATPIKDDLFAGTEKFSKGASDVTEVDMDPDSLRLVGGNNATKARQTILNVVRTYSYDKPGMYNMADVEEYRRKLETGDWHCSLHARDAKSGESTDICSRRRAPDMIENAIITVEPKELTFIHTIKKINGQGGSLDTGTPEAFIHLPPEVAMVALQPEMSGEMLAQTAQMRSRMSEMMESLRSAQELSLREMREQMQKLREQMNDLHGLPGLSPEQQKQQRDQLQRLRDQLKDAPTY